MNNNKTCYLLGSNSLLIQCAQILKDEDFDIQRIVSSDKEIITWASSLQIEVVSPNKILTLLECGDVDYIFSITNLDLIPSNILRLAKKMAINFHNGLLPDYAGLNVTTWAIANQETHHGITWHIMTPDVDQGDVIDTVRFPIEGDETALTLNAKCYQAALDSFPGLISAIIKNKMQLKPQESEKFDLYLKNKRPAANGIINWNQSASSIDAMVRALDFGAYENPVGLAKILVGPEFFVVKECRIQSEKSSKAGLFVSVDLKIIVSTGDYDLEIVSLLDSNGRQVSADNFCARSGLQVGELLPVLSDELTEALGELDKAFSLQEAEWVQNLQNIDQLHIPICVPLPDPRENGRPRKSSQEITALGFSTADECLSSLALFFSKIAGIEEFDIFLHVVDESHQIQPFVEQLIPIHFSTSPEAPIGRVWKQFKGVIASTRSATKFSKDIYLRYPQLNPEGVKFLVLSDTFDENLLDSLGNCRFELLLNYNARENVLDWHCRGECYSAEQISYLQKLFESFVANVHHNSKSSYSQCPVLSAESTDQMINEWNQTDLQLPNQDLVHELFETQAIKTPGHVAVSLNGQQITYKELSFRANAVAHQLVNQGVKPDELVGVLIGRSIGMVVALLGVLKSGAAYLPIDPAYPEDRIRFMLDDGKAKIVIVDSDTINLVNLKQIRPISIDSFLDGNPGTAESPDRKISGENLAYTIYTSGSTGKPKGVMVEHRNLTNFIHAMSHHIDPTPGVWLAVTSISFDISALEIFWSLANGFEVALYSEDSLKLNNKQHSRFPDIDMQFGMYYWDVADEDTIKGNTPYRLLLESAKYADENGFSALWTPERHFGAFGGLYPNPSVISAALAVITSNIDIRAGSCVTPLHHPARITEEWSVVDNLSGGRIALSMASGWNPNDFLLMPDNYTNAKEVLYDNIEIIRQLWRGEVVEFDGPKGDKIGVKTYPKPIQKELPIWITSAGNPETFKSAGKSGFNILTHLLGQDIAQVQKNLEIYREAYKKAGHKGNGHVSVLLHTLVGKDESWVKETAREPMKKYLKSAMFLVRGAAWHFPTFKELSEDTGQTLDQFFETISDEDMDALLDFSFERYYQTSGLLGSVEKCTGMIDSLKEIGVNEIGCLIDFGIDADTVMAQLPYLNEVKKICTRTPGNIPDNTPEWTIGDIIRERKVTHLQCTPSMAELLLSDQDTREELARISHLMVGGEAASARLINRLRQFSKAKISNFYGPTETTIWSLVQELEGTENSIAIGKPIANTQTYILDNDMLPVPIGFPGELYIGGNGVTRGYFEREALTTECFVPNQFSKDPTARMYRTGDYVRYQADGTIEFIGRTDHQVKIRGYRIELGEIENRLLTQDQIKVAAAVVLEKNTLDKRIVAFIQVEETADFDLDKLRWDLRDELPEFMLPSKIIKLKSFLLTPNGKIDRNALLQFENQYTQPEPRSVAKAENVLQGDLLMIWKEVLDLDDIGIEDKFFDIGGHSLLVPVVLTRLRDKHGLSLKMIDMFRYQSISQLSQYIESSSESGNLQQNQERNDRVG